LCLTLLSVMVVLVHFRRSRKGCAGHAGSACQHGLADLAGDRHSGRDPAPTHACALCQQALACALAAQPGWLPLLGGYERLCAIAFHIAMSVVVLQAFRRGRLRWLWYAIGLHFLFDFGAVALATGLPKLTTGLGATEIALIVEGWATLFAVSSLWLIFALRDNTAPEVENAASASGALSRDTPDARPLAG
jgi:hypothetical protein